MFDVDVKRETRRLSAERAQIDVSLDAGAVIAGEQRAPLHEIELELVSGELDDLFGEAKRVSDAVDGRLHAAHQGRRRLCAEPYRAQALVARIAIAPLAGHHRRRLPFGRSFFIRLRI